MQIAAKSTFVLIIIYLLGLGGAAVWLERDYQKTTQDIMSDTAELVARQISAILHEPVVDELLNRDENAFKTLSEIIETSVDRSEVVKSLAVVDQNGDLIVGGREDVDYPTPDTKFGDDPSIQVISNFDKRFSSGQHIAYMPIQKKGVPVGYLKAVLGNKRIDLLFDSLVGHITNFAVVGLFAILVLGGLLHFELSRLGRDIVGLMKSGKEPSPKNPVFGNDEFHDVRTEARVLGAKSRQNMEELGLLTRALQVGLLLIDQDGKPVFISQNAREILMMDHSDEIPASLKEAWEMLINESTELSSFKSASKILNVDIESNENTKTLEFELLKSSGTAGHTLALVRDKDTMLALDESLRAAARMHTLSSIYLGAAHDLRAPISAMVMNLELLESSIQTKADAEVDSQIANDRARYITILRDELVRLQRFLDSFLSTATVSRNDSREAVELTTIIEELVRLFMTQANQLGIEIKSTLPETSVYVHASSDQLRQVFMNLIVNAYEVMPNGGLLGVSVELDRSSAVVKILDSGPGIPSTLLDRVFDMHFTTKASGTGIGLYVARNVIEQHGGTISVSSSLGEGSEFTISLPVHSPE